MKTPPHFGLFCLTTICAAGSSILLAAESAEQTFTNAAERWGLWAALTLALVLAMLYGLYKIVGFVLTTLVGLLQENQHLMTKVADAIRHAPCGADWDSDGKDIEETPGGTKSLSRVRRRQDRQDRQGLKSEGT